MKGTLLTFSLTLASLALPAQAQELLSDQLADFPPRKFDALRYKAIWARNPFVAEVVGDGVVEAAEPWAKDLILRAVTRIEGKYVVHVENTALANEKDPVKARGRYQRLVEDAAGLPSDELRIVGVKAHRDPNQVEITLAREEGSESQEAVVKYDPKALLVAQGANTPGSLTQIPSQGMPQTRQVINPPAGGPANANLRGTRGAPNRGRGGAAAAGGRRGAGGPGGDRGSRFQGGRATAAPGSANGTSPPRRVILPPGTSR